MTKSIPNKVMLLFIFSQIYWQLSCLVIIVSQNRSYFLASNQSDVTT